MLSSLQSFGHVVDWPSFMNARAAEAEDPRLIEFYSNLSPVDVSLGEAEFIALDIETTGLNPETDGIVSLGMISFSLQTIFCKQSEYWLFKPEQTLAEDSVVIHGITHSEVKNQPDLSSKLDELLYMIRGKFVVVHCMSIERNFIYNAVKRRLGEGLLFPLIDTMAIEIEQQQKSRTLVDKLLKRNQPAVRLLESRQRYNLPEYHSHHALNDAFATAELFQAQAAYHFSPEMPVKNLLR